LFIPAGIPNFKVLSQLVSKLERVPKFDVGLLAPNTSRMLKLTCAPQVLGKIKFCQLSAL